MRTKKQYTSEARGQAYRDRDPARMAARSRVMYGLAALFGGLLVAFFIQATLTANQSMLDRIFWTVAAGVFAVLTWAGGSSVVKALERLRFED